MSTLFGCCLWDGPHSLFSEREAYPSTQTSVSVSMHAVYSMDIVHHRMVSLAVYNVCAGLPSHIRKCIHVCSTYKYVCTYV